MQASFTDHAFERHSHDAYAIGVTAYGTQNFRCRGKQYSSRAGDLVLFNPDEDHDGDRGDSAGFGYMIWYLPEHFVRSCVDADAGLKVHPYLGAPHRQDTQMAAMFGQITRSLLAYPHETLRSELLMREFVGTLLSRYGERPQPQATPQAVAVAHLLRVKDYMRAHFHDELTVAELAAVAGLSRAHFTRAFSAAFYTPPHVYLNAVRISHAQTLMRAGAPLAMVAADCGFSDQSHFSRRFKGSIGVSPDEWRRAHGSSSSRTSHGRYLAR